MADVGKDPVPIIKKAVQMTKNKNKVEILWASTRTLQLHSSQTIRMSNYNYATSSYRCF